MNSPLSAAEKIWHMIEQFHGYAFCKAHSASYTQISYESAYLRCHYPAEFMAAVLSNGGGYYHAQAYISECMRLGLQILPPHINHCNLHYIGVNRSIYIGLLAIKEFSLETATSIIKEREKNGLFTSLYDYLYRTQTSFLENQRLNLLDAFAEITPYNNSQIYWLLHEYYRYHHDAQLQLFAPEEKIPPELNPLSTLEKYQHQCNLLGYLIQEHPLILYQEELLNNKIPYLPSNLISKHIDQNITVLGMPITQKTTLSKHGRSMGFYSFEDQFSIYDITLFPKAYEKYHHFITANVPCFLHGKVESQYNTETIIVDWVKRIPTKR